MAVVTKSYAMVHDDTQGMYALGYRWYNLAKRGMGRMTDYVLSIFKRENGEYKSAEAVSPVLDSVKVQVDKYQDKVMNDFQKHVGEVMNGTETAMTKYNQEEQTDAINSAILEKRGGVNDDRLFDVVKKYGVQRVQNTIYAKMTNGILEMNLPNYDKKWYRGSTMTWVKFGAKFLSILELIIFPGLNQLMSYVGGFIALAHGKSFTEGAAAGYSFLADGIDALINYSAQKELMDKYGDDYKPEWGKDTLDSFIHPFVGSGPNMFVVSIIKDKAAKQFKDNPSKVQGIKDLLDQLPTHTPLIDATMNHFQGSGLTTKDVMDGMSHPASTTAAILSELGEGETRHMIDLFKDSWKNGLKEDTIKFYTVDKKESVDKKDEHGNVMRDDKGNVIKEDKVTPDTTPGLEMAKNVDNLLTGMNTLLNGLDTVRNMGMNVPVIQPHTDPNELQDIVDLTKSLTQVGK